MSVLSALSKLRFVVALMVATIGLQAVPAGAIIAADRGPAFSASSIDVALAVRGEPASATRLAPLPVSPPQVVATSTSTVETVSQRWTVYDPAAPVRGPPRRAFPSPREPPVL